MEKQSFTNAIEGIVGEIEELTPFTWSSNHTPIFAIAKVINIPSLEKPEIHFPKPLLYPLKQWATSSSSPSLAKRHKPENPNLPENIVSSQKTPKTNRKTYVNHAEKAQMKEAKE